MCDKPNMILHMGKYVMFHCNMTYMLKDGENMRSSTTDYI